MSGQNGSPEGGQESGSEFRQKFEALQAENAQLRTGLATTVAERFEYVKPEDLQGVESDQLAARAAEIQEQRQTERRQILESELKGRGLSEEQIAKVLEGGPVGQSTAPPATSYGEALGAIGGAPVPRTVDVSNMSPDQKIAAGIAARKSKR